MPGLGLGRQQAQKVQGGRLSQWAAVYAGHKPELPVTSGAPLPGIEDVPRVTWDCREPGLKERGGWAMNRSKKSYWRGGEAFPKHKMPVCVHVSERVDGG